MKKMFVVVFLLTATGCQSGLGFGETPPPVLPPARMEYIAEFKKIDTGGKGRISMDDAITYYTAKFKELDTNKDGYLTADEIEPLVPVMNATSGKELIARLARSSTVKISQSEFLIIANWLFQLAKTKDELTLSDVEKG